MLKVGDNVSVIHDEISGKIISLSGPKVTIEDSDGFVRSYNSIDLAINKRNSYNIDTHEAKQFIEEKEDKIRPLKISVQKGKVVSSQVSNINSNEIDLHIEVLLPEAVNWGVGDILQKQMMACRAFVEKAVANKSKKVILIHGKGEGVLKSEIYRYLNRVQDYLHISVSYHDADFRTFGTGATQVNFQY